MWKVNYWSIENKLAYFFSLNLIGMWKTLIDQSSKRVSYTVTSEYIYNQLKYSVVIFGYSVQPSNYTLWFYTPKLHQNIPKSHQNGTQITPEVLKIMYLGHIFLNGGRQTIFLHCPLPKSGPTSPSMYLCTSTRNRTGNLTNQRGRDQREWVFEVREVKSKNKKLSLFFEKCKVKK